MKAGVFSFNQSMPNGVDQHNIPMLLRRVADTLDELDEVVVQNLSLHIPDPQRDKPSVSVYYTVKSVNVPKEAREYAVNEAAVVVSHTKSRGSLVDLIGNIDGALKSTAVKDFYDIFINDLEDESGKKYKVIIYYE